MDKDHNLSGSEEMDRREGKAEEFFRELFDVDERPYFVSDEATLYDIFVGDEAQLIVRCKAYYGVRLQVSDFRIAGERAPRVGLASPAKWSTS